jgi:glycosyltransferase involved in cell wall biosynthesis/SAM-dependent methyltransferase
MDKARIAAHFDRMAPERDAWKWRNRYYYESLESLCRSLIPPHRAVLEIGCGSGDLLAAVEPSFGVGVDLSLGILEVARRKYPQYHFLGADAERIPLVKPFDFIIMSDLVGHLTDVWQAFGETHKVCGSQTRLVLTYYNLLWQPILEVGEMLGLKMPQQYQNWLSPPDIENLLRLGDFEVEEVGWRLLLPKRIPWLSDWVNARAYTIPLLRQLCLQNYVVAHPRAQPSEVHPLTCSVIIPCRNEVDNIADCVERLPSLGSHTEIIFVDGNSNDGTPQAIMEMIERHRGKKDIKLVHQVEAMETDIAQHASTAPDMMLSLGKGDAVRKGFERASGDVLMILDADLTVPPEDLPKFYLPLAQGKARFVNGTRLVYPMEAQAMKTLNYLGNCFFGRIFSWLLGQRVTDTLCGTKALLKDDYEALKRGRTYFGNFDPFGDFDLLFGAARLGLAIVEAPVRYHERATGRSKVRVLRHGILLLRMTLIGFWKLKLLRWLRRLVGGRGQHAARGVG